jgi:acetyl-CoA carboxylase biotin carboxylase subunit
MFERILIANRGEIAVRVMRACREMGIEPIAIYSDADERALHTSLATRAVRVGNAPASESYLSIDAVLAAAQATAADAIHPGYGFLSENADFAAACAAAGIVFIGPSPAAMISVGSKINARALAERAGVPVIPGEAPADQRDETLLAAAGRIGYPVLLKPSAGGGGIGMKVVTAPAGFPDAAAQARREAQAAFGDPTLYLERLIEEPRHVEFQVMADHHGGVVHLFERECSLQRRHQKVIEESPSVALSAALRQRMGDAAVRVARAAGYTGAGTVEFLVEGAGDTARFYFLEVNARLQVEHPVTEMVAGVDLVRAQIRIAAGESLPWTQEQLSQRGHAIEQRLYAEDPARGYLPQAGRVALYREPSMPGVRVDAGVAEGSDVPVHYDPLLAKLIVWGEDRESARQRALAALNAFPILGLRTNQPLLRRILEHPRFAAGTLDTHFLEREHDRLTTPQPPGDIAAAVAEAVARAASRLPDARQSSDSAPTDPWDRIAPFHV